MSRGPISGWHATNVPDWPVDQPASSRSIHSDRGHQIPLPVKSPAVCREFSRWSRPWASPQWAIGSFAMAMIAREIEQELNHRRFWNPRRRAGPSRLHSGNTPGHAGLPDGDPRPANGAHRCLHVNPKDEIIATHLARLTILGDDNSCARKSWGRKTALSGGKIKKYQLAKTGLFHLRHGTTAIQFFIAPLPPLPCARVCV